MRLCNIFHAVTLSTCAILVFGVIFSGASIRLTDAAILLSVGLAASALILFSMSLLGHSGSLRKEQHFLTAVADREAAVRWMLTDSIAWPLSKDELDIAIPSRSPRDPVAMTLILSPTCYTCLEIIRYLADGGLTGNLEHFEINIIMAEHADEDRSNDLRGLIRQIAGHQGTKAAVEFLFKVGGIAPDTPNKLRHLIDVTQANLGKVSPNTHVPTVPDVPWTPYLLLNDRAPAEERQGQLLNFLKVSQLWEPK